MGRLLDNLPERDNSSGGSGSQCTTPSSQSVSASQQHVDLTDVTVARSTDVPSLARCLGSDSSKTAGAGCETVPRETAASVQSKSTADELQTSVRDTGMNHLIKTSNGCHQSTYTSAQSELCATSCSQFHNVCMASQEPSWSSSATVRQLPHSRLDVSITRDIPTACRPITVPTSCSRGRLSPISVSSVTVRSKPLCVTTPSSTGRGGLLAFDYSSHHMHSGSSGNLNGLISNSAEPPHTYSRPVTNSETRHSDWVTTHDWVLVP